MHERVETMLFSAIAVLLAAMTLGGLSDLAFPDARAVASERATQFARNSACTATAAASAARSGADRRG